MSSEKRISAAIRDAIRTRTPEMFTLLEDMVRIQSGSYNKRGVDRVGRLVAGALAETDMRIESVKQAARGNHLIVRSTAPATSGRQILMTGHMDTVFPEDTDFTWYREDESNAYGPGVSDMKGGLVAGIFALKALATVGCLNDIPLVFILNADEEIGSTTSREIIYQAAAESGAAFVLEAGGLDNGIVTGRKGNLSVRVSVKGKAGHAAFAGTDKASAVLALAHITTALEALNRNASGITVNVGRIEGGIGANTIAEQAEALVDFRFKDAAGRQDIVERITAILQDTRVPGTSAHMDIVSSRPAMPAGEENRRLYAFVSRTAESLGMLVREEYRYGVSDANLIAAAGTPVLDGLGPIGGKDHSAAEFMIKESLPQRAMLLACALFGCARYF